MIIPIDKKCGAQDCGDFRTISLMSHASKIVLKILTRRLESTAESYFGKDQFVFRKGRATKDAPAALRQLYERYLEYNNKVYINYVNMKYKLLTRLHQIMMILQNTRVDWRFGTYTINR